MTDKKNDTNEKKEDAATERAREIVNAMFEGKSTLANSATSKEELPEDAASKVAVVAGRAAGKLAVGFGKAARTVSGNAVAVNNKEAAAKKKARVAVNGSSAVKKRAHGKADRSTSSKPEAEKRAGKEKETSAMNPSKKACDAVNKEKVISNKPSEPKAEQENGALEEKMQVIQRQGDVSSPDVAAQEKSHSSVAKDIQGNKAEATSKSSKKEVVKHSAIAERTKVVSARNTRNTGLASSAASMVASLVQVPVNRHAAKKEAQEVVKEERRSVLESADYTSSYKAYQKMLTKGGARKSGVLVELHNTPGCYAVATYPPKLKWDRDLASYTDIYVGMSARAGEGILECCSRQGCADVYADIKYKQNVQIFIFSCGEDELEGLQEELIQELGANESYNALL